MTSCRRFLGAVRLSKIVESCEGYRILVDPFFDKKLSIRARDSLFSCV